MVHLYEYITYSGLEIQKQKLIWKTSDFIMALQSGWGFEDLKNVIFEHFQGQFS